MAGDTSFSWGDLTLFLNSLDLRMDSVSLEIVYSVHITVVKSSIVTACDPKHGPKYRKYWINIKKKKKNKFKHVFCLFIQCCMAQPILGGLPLPVGDPLEPPGHSLHQLNSSTPITFSGCFTFFFTNLGFAPSDPLGLLPSFLPKWS